MSNAQRFTFCLSGVHVFRVTKIYCIKDVLCVISTQYVGRVSILDRQEPFCFITHYVLQFELLSACQSDLL